MHGRVCRVVLTYTMHVVHWQGGRVVLTYTMHVVHWQGGRLMLTHTVHWQGGRVVLTAPKGSCRTCRSSGTGFQHQAYQCFHDVLERWLMVQKSKAKQQSKDEF